MSTDTKLIDALLTHDLGRAQELIDSGVDINAGYGPDEWTALHYVAEKGINDEAAWLLTKGANVNAKDAHGWTPLHVAIDAEADSARQELVSKGVSSISSQLVELLLKNGADPNAQTDSGKTVLSLAYKVGHAEAADLLKQFGAALER